MAKLIVKKFNDFFGIADIETMIWVYSFLALCFVAGLYVIVL